MTKLEILVACTFLFSAIVYYVALVDAKKRVKPVEPEPKKDEK